VHDFAREALKVFRISQTYGIKLICASEVGIQTSRLVRYEFLFGPKHCSSFQNSAVRLLQRAPVNPRNCRATK
jgi:hypothetical protein